MSIDWPDGNTITLEDFTGCKAAFSAAKFKNITLGLLTAGLYNRT